MRIRYLDREYTLDAPVTLDDFLKRTAPAAEETIYACLDRGELLERIDPVPDGAILTPVTYRDEVGRRIYERTLRFVMLLAMHRLFPASTVRVEHSISHGIFLRLLDRRLTRKDLEAVDDEMRRIIADDLPFKRFIWSKEKIIRWFNEDHEEERSRILSFQPDQSFKVYQCDDLIEYSYGPVAPSTGYADVFALRLLTPGIAMMLPAKEAPRVPAPYVSRPKNVAAFAESNRWCQIMGLNNAADVNDAITSGRFRELIRVNEALHDKSIADIADGIRDKGSKAVFIAGPSSSGKTTFANRLRIHLKVLGLDPDIISLDDYYRPKNEVPLGPDGKPDLETPQALDLPRLRKNVSQLLNGQPAVIPHYDFKTGLRNDNGRLLTPAKDRIVIFEGIHALNSLLFRGLTGKVFTRIYISELTCLNIDNHNRIRTTEARLLRRLVRDHSFRNTPFMDTLDMWPSVRDGEEKWIFPYQEKVDYVFNSVLHYELPILKRRIFDVLRAVTPDQKDYLMAQRLKNLLQYFLEAPEDAEAEVPPLSILREFIGGNTFYQ